MSLADIVNSQISATTVNPTRPGFGVPLIAGYFPTSVFPQRIQYFQSLSALAQAGFSVTGHIYKAASAIMAQKQPAAPAKFAVGRCALPGTQVLALTLTDAVVGEQYTLQVIGTDGVTNTITFSSTGVPATDAATLAGLFPLSPVTHVGTGTPVVTVTGTPAASGPFGVTVTLGGPVGTATFSWSFGGTTTTGVATASTVALGSTGVTVDFAAGTYVLGDTYSFVAVANCGTISHTSATVTITGALGGTLIDVLNRSTNITLADNTADPGIATDLAAIYQADPTGWYGVCLRSNSKLEIEAAAAWAEANGKLFAANNSDSANWNAASTSDVAYQLKSRSYARTYLQHSESQVLSYAGAAMLGNRLPSNPGSDTWDLKTLAGVEVDTLTETQQNALAAKNCNYYTEIAGENVTNQGVSPSGEYMDVTRFINWLNANIQIDVFQLLLSLPKVPYTDIGIDMIVNVVKNRLKIGGSPAYGGIDLTQPYTVTAPTAETVDSGNKNNRNLPNVTWSASLAGAIQTVDPISGSLN